MDDYVSIDNVTAAPESRPRGGHVPTGYSAAHNRARLVHIAEPCLHCGAVDGVQVALRQDAATRLVETRRVGFVGLSYSPDPGDYISLCVTCHRAYDA